ncbi:hypothetical protein T4E_6469 [Trichinella pseudospiralis]|uniref:Uncharacterized protein n=1 Tax=Trichinella pseudospiralis TaxID=6337 RepID=A0A0V0YJ05_TRIPS|nr:hypothetical protein T4E_6469 [Trichinella pseudospiralis]
MTPPDEQFQRGHFNAKSILIKYAEIDEFYHLFLKLFLNDFKRYFKIEDSNLIFSHKPLLVV